MDDVKRAIFAALTNGAVEIVIETRRVVYVCGKRFHHPKNRLLILSWEICWLKDFTDMVQKVWISSNLLVSRYFLPENHDRYKSLTWLVFKKNINCLWLLFSNFPVFILGVTLLWKISLGRLDIWGKGKRISSWK